MTHRCHWPNCGIEVPPKMWGCKKHWFRLPLQFRDEIWRTYRPGQENEKNPNTEYLAIADRVQTWCYGFNAGRQSK